MESHTGVHRLRSEAQSRALLLQGGLFSFAPFKPLKPRCCNLRPTLYNRVALQPLAASIERFGVFWIGLAFGHLHVS